MITVTTREGINATAHEMSLLLLNVDDLVYIFNI